MYNNNNIRVLTCPYLYNIYIYIYGRNNKFSSDTYYYRPRKLVISRVRFILILYWDLKFARNRYTGIVKYIRCYYNIDQFIYYVIILNTRSTMKNTRWSETSEMRNHNNNNYYFGPFRHAKANDIL